MSLLYGLITTSGSSLQNVSHTGFVPLFIGASCGAMIYTLNLEKSRLGRRISAFFISLILGIGCADTTACLLNATLDKFFSPPPAFNRTFLAALTAAVAVRLINTLSDLLFTSLKKKGG